MNYLPIFYDVRDRHCLVVGGSETAARKAELLLRAGAFVDVVASSLHVGFEQLPHRGRLNRVADVFSADLLDGKDAVIVVTDDAALKKNISELARVRHLPVNVADTPALCSFILPSIIDRSPIIVAVSSGGARLKEESDAYKARIVAQADGDAQRFRSVLIEYQKAPQVTRAFLRDPDGNRVEAVCHHAV